jgi:beta-fructofuranosidase
MHQLYYQPRGYWFGDCMPFYHGGKFYLYHQRDTRQPGPFGEPFGWALALTDDFVHYEDMGEVLARGGDEAQDQFVFAGSLFEAQGTFYALYTGFNRDYPRLGKPAQVLMLASSQDLIHWDKSSEKLVAPQPGYDPNDWRDPFVFWNEAAQEYVMILGARKLDGQKIRTGRTVYFTSQDLKRWDFKGDFWAPGLFYMHEMPDVFKMGEYWYLLTTEYSDKARTCYRMSRSLDGPWVAPLDDAFDGKAYYAARSYSDGQKRYLFGWVATKEDQDERKNWQWGGTLVVHEVYPRPDGTLAVKAPEGVLHAFATRERLTDQAITLETVDSCQEVLLAQDSGDLFKFEATVAFAAGTRAFGVRLFEDQETGEAYEFRLSVGEQRLTFGRTPNLPWYRYLSMGLERPVLLEANQKYHLQVIADDTIATLYLDGVALNARVYAKAGHAIALYVVDGTLEIEDAAIEKGLK